MHAAFLLVPLVALRPVAFAQTPLDLTAHLHVQVMGKDQGTVKTPGQPPTAIWLAPIHSNGFRTSVPSNNYSLTQKDKQFVPHLLIVPVGSVVRFPNADPFFHNVFSLFDGRRFDLGLYEAGSAKEVNFFREGVSYIFCNIHPEMSAVVIALSTPFFGIADRQGTFEIHRVPPGTYTLHVWVEGANQATLDKLTRLVQIEPGLTDLGEIAAPVTHLSPGHENKFEQPYDQDEPSAY